LKIKSIRIISLKEFLGTIKNIINQNNLFEKILKKYKNIYLILE
jgi:hypothetical protein